MKTQRIIDYRAIVGYGDFDRNDRDRLHRIGDIIRQQNETAVFAGKLMGFQRLASLAVRGRAGKAISEIEKKTRSFEHGQLSFYDGSRGTVPKLRNDMIGDCSCYIDYIDACLFGARLAESAEKYPEALKLYQRAYKVLKTRGGNREFGGWLFGKYLPNGYAKEYQDRERMLRSGIKRTVKKSGGKIK